MNAQSMQHFVGETLSIWCAVALVFFAKIFSGITPEDLIRTTVLAAIGGVIGWSVNKLLNFITNRKNKNNTVK